MSTADANRRPGSFAIAVRTAPVQVGRRIGLEGAEDIWHRLVAMGERGGQGCVGVERWAPRQHLEQHDPAAYTSLAAVAGAPLTSSGARYFGVPMMSPITVTSPAASSRRLAIPKSASFTPPSGPEQDVAWLDVAGTTPTAWAAASAASTPNARLGLRLFERPVGDQPIGQRLPFDQFHDEVEVTIGFAGVEERPPRRVGERRRAACLV